MTKVARRGEDGKMRWLSWKELPRLQWLKKLYKTNPNSFTEIEGVLYRNTIDGKTSEKLRTLLNSCVKIAGTKYALALTLSGGDRKGYAFKKTLEALNTRTFQDKLYWVETFENHIKEYGIKVAIVDDGVTHWLELSGESMIKVSVLKSYFSKKPTLFEKIDNLVFFLPNQNILLENMFFRCIELAGGEHALASELSGDRLTKERHLKNFERMSFRHDKNYKTYSELFSRYLARNQTLFDEECIYA